MPAILTGVVVVAIAYLSTFLYRFIKNFQHARASGLPYIVVPVDQNHVLWMMLSVPLRPLLERHLPSWLYERISLVIYGHEFHDLSRAYDTYIAPQKTAHDKSYALVTCGLFEFQTCDAEIIQDVLKRPNDFVSSEFVALFLSRFGNNLFISNGKDWSRQRKVVAGVINERISRTVFAESATQTRGLLDEVVGDASHGETIRLFDMMKKITINVLSGAGMGTNVEWDSTADEKPREGFRFTYIQAIKHVIESITGLILLPNWFFNSYPSFLPGHAFMRSIGTAFVEFPHLIADLLDRERARARASGGESHSNIMSQLLQACEDPAFSTTTTTTTTKPNSKPALSPDELMGNLFIFTVAGFDTTANTLAYALVLLVRHPEWQDWLFAEIDDIMPSDPSQPLDYTSIFPRATRTLAYMFETLRLYSPLVHMAKQTRAPQTITTASGATISLPARTTVYLDLVALHRNPAVWRNLNLPASASPSDTDELLFRPSRWLLPTSPPTLYTPPRGTFIPWSAGPRVCPGQKMSQVEFVTIFLSLLRRHRVDAVPLLGSKVAGLETREEMERRLDATIQDSISVLTLQMQGVYDVGGREEEGRAKRGVKVRLSRRR